MAGKTFFSICATAGMSSTVICRILICENPSPFPGVLFPPVTGADNPACVQLHPQPFPDGIKCRRVPQHMPHAAYCNVQVQTGMAPVNFLSGNRQNRHTIAQKYGFLSTFIDLCGNFIDSYRTLRKKCLHLPIGKVYSPVYACCRRASISGHT